MFSREFRRQEGAKSKHIFEIKGGKRLEMWPAACLLACPLGAGGQGNSCYFAGVSKIGQDSAGRSAFCPLSCFALGALSLNMALFRVLRAFLAWFRVFVRVCVACVLCVACGAFVCVSG